MKKKLPLRRRAFAILCKTGMYLAAGITAALLVFLIGYIFVKGLPNITWELLTTASSTLKGTTGILPNLVNTLYIIVLTLIVVLPLGVFTHQSCCFLYRDILTREFWIVTYI